MSGARPPLDLSLYLVVGPGDTGGRPLADVVLDAVAGGVTAVQLRWKDAPARRFVEEARALTALLRPRGVPLLVNDRADVALAAADRADAQDQPVAVDDDRAHPRVARRLAPRRRDQAGEQRGVVRVQVLHEAGLPPGQGLEAGRPVRRGRHRGPPCVARVGLLHPPVQVDPRWHQLEDRLPW